MSRESDVVTVAETSPMPKLAQPVVGAVTWTDKVAVFDVSLTGKDAAGADIGAVSTLMYAFAKQGEAMPTEFAASDPVSGAGDVKVSITVPDYGTAYDFYFKVVA